MTSLCLPPESLRDNPGWHWLKIPDEERPFLPAFWDTINWQMMPDIIMSPQSTAKHGAVYYAPVTPPDEAYVETSPAP